VMHKDVNYEVTGVQASAATVLSADDNVREKDLERAGRELTALVIEKNEAYGDSFSAAAEVLRIFYPNGIRPDQYVDALGIVRVVDKLNRIAHKKDAFGESPWRDVAGYGLIGYVTSQDDTERSGQ